MRQEKTLSGARTLPLVSVFPSYSQYPDTRPKLHNHRLPFLTIHLRVLFTTVMLTDGEELPSLKFDVVIVDDDDDGV